MPLNDRAVRFPARVFLAAALLRDDAVALRDAADTGDLTGADRALRQIQADCYSCHSQYRVLPVIEPPADKSETVTP